MSQIAVTLPDGATRTLAAGSTAGDLARAIGARLAKDALVARVNGELRDLSTVLANGDDVAIVVAGSQDGRDVTRHSTAHVLAQAVTRLWPGAKYAIGPAIENGFYYDFDLPGGARFSDDDLERIEAEMRGIIAEDQPFTRVEVSTEEGLDVFADQPYKVEIISKVREGARDAEDLG